MRLRHKTIVWLLRIFLPAVLVLLILVGGLGLRLRWIERPRSTTPIIAATQPVPLFPADDDPAFRQIRSLGADFEQFSREELSGALRTLESRDWPSLATGTDLARQIEALSVSSARIHELLQKKVDQPSGPWHPGNRVARADQIEGLAMVLCLKAHQLASSGNVTSAVDCTISGMGLSCLLGSASPACYLRGYELCRTTVRHFQILYKRHDAFREACPGLPAKLLRLEARILLGAELLRREYITAIDHVQWTLGATERMFPTPGPAGPVLRELPLLHRVLVASEKETKRNIEWLFGTFIAASGDAPWDAWALEETRQRILGSDREEFWYYKDPLGRFFARDMVNPLLDVVITERSWHALLRTLAVWDAASRYVQTYGNVPDSVDTLAPEFLPSLPLDPFRTVPISLSRSANGTWVVYSVGADGDDNGATAGAWFAESADSYSDLVLSDPSR